MQCEYVLHILNGNTNANRECKSWQFFKRRQSGLHRQINTSAHWQNETYLIALYASRTRECMYVISRIAIRFNLGLLWKLAIFRSVIYKSCWRAKLLTKCIRVTTATTTREKNNSSQKKANCLNRTSCSLFFFHLIQACMKKVNGLGEQQWTQRQKRNECTKRQCIQLLVPIRKLVVTWMRKCA